MSNPLDLPGPQFLLFYLGLGVAVLVALRMLRSVSEGGDPPRLDTSDPHLIAYLRGGKNEALRVGTVSLIDRGLLEIDDKDAVCARSGAAEAAARPVERALLRHFERPRAATDIFDDAELEAACAEYRARLTRLDLLPSDETKRTRRRRLMLGLLVLVGLSAAKIWVALGRGRTNIGFLILMTLFFAVVAAAWSRPFRTARGDALLEDLRILFRRLKERAGSFRPNAAPGDLALLAAVFGLAVLPASGFAYARRLYPKAASASGSSCGASCGSSCGGGNGGGGCGGCGGGGGD